ncbi:hypothetical protein BAY60_20020 [Prauserella muralis]|uniref:Alpha/beta-hydrolase family protein n=1 Tax=Prauserella muralis TaxID=588067 RepID=A0A2V4AQK1_9PSEU|nr:hypothetical protein BAY60_20020 [Prauserella muralis]
MREHVDFLGAVFGLCFYCVSLTPSLLPRPWLLQGLISGLAVGIGYLLGVCLGAVGRRLWRRRADARLGELAWRMLGYTAGPLLASFAYLGAVWQRELSALMGLPVPATLPYLAVPLIAVVIFLELLAVARVRGRAARRFGRVLARRLRPVTARRTAAIAVTILVALVQLTVGYGLLAVANDNFRTSNHLTPEGVTRPVAAERSGSPASLVPWESLGRDGRAFIASGPAAADLARFSGRPASTPVRVYAGLESAPSIRDAAALAVRELERTGAFSREVLAVVTSTGTGWVDDEFLTALEYLYNGDTAVATIQYSYLPSWLSFVLDGSQARTAGRELFEQVRARWSRVPPAERPRLLVFGESLGAYGAEAAFRDLTDMRARTDGVLLVGPPHNSPIWHELVRGRDPGSPEALPVYGGGAAVRFAHRAADLGRPAGPWMWPRVLYLQRASDPVVWWSPDLLVGKPTWITERGAQPADGGLRWYPFITFAQLTADLGLANDMPSGFGHRYREMAVTAWLAIAPPPGWTGDDTARLEALLRERR